MKRELKNNSFCMKVFVLLILSFSIFIFRGVTGYAAGDKWTVTFHTGEDVIKRSIPEPQIVKDGKQAEKPEQNPIGYKYHPFSENLHGQFDPDDPSQGPDGETRIPSSKFVGWYEDKEFTKEYDFETLVTKDIDLYAKWELNPNSGAVLKAFDRETLETEHDDGYYKAPGNIITDVRVGDKFSYQYMTRNREAERPDVIIGGLENFLPDEIELPTKVELFTIDGKGDVGFQLPVYDTLKVHEVPEKSKVTSIDKDEYYEITTDTNGVRIIVFHNIKDDVVKGRNFVGYMFDTKLIKQPKINEAKDYKFLNQTKLVIKNLLAYKYYASGKFKEDTYDFGSYYTLHVPWKVEFEPNGGTPKPKDQLVRNTKLATKPTGKDQPTKPNKNFEGWYEDKELTKKFDFKTPIEKDWILYAKWTDYPALSLEKKVNKPEFKVGERASYELTMKDTANSDLLEPHLKDNLPPGMSEPKNLKLDGVTISKGDSNSQRPYYTWDDNDKRLDVYYDRLKLGETRKITYDSDILSGKAKEVKKNTAVLTGSNTTEKVTATAEFIIVDRDVLLHVKQEVIGKHEDIVVPKTGFLSFDHVKVATPTDKKNQLSLVIPSYEADTKKDYKDVKLTWSEEYAGFTPNIRIPEFYAYDGYQLTTDTGSHDSSKKDNTKMRTIDVSKNNEYWLTIYIKPTTTQDGPPFYNWDYKENKFDKIKVK